MSTYRVYIRWGDQRADEESKTVTKDQAVAEFAFDILKTRPPADADNARVVLSRDNRGVRFFDFKTGRVTELP